MRRTGDDAETGAASHRARLGCRVNTANLNLVFAPSPQVVLTRMSASGAAPTPHRWPSGPLLLACAAPFSRSRPPTQSPAGPRQTPTPGPQSAPVPHPPTGPPIPPSGAGRGLGSGSSRPRVPGQCPGRLPRAHPLDEEAFLEHAVLHVAARASRACGRSRCAVPAPPAPPAPPARAAPRRSLGTRAGGACLAGVQSRRPRGLPGRKSCQVGVSDADASAKVR